MRVCLTADRSLAREGNFLVCSVHIENMCIKQLWSRKAWDFAAAFRVWKLFATFEKRAPEYGQNCPKKFSDYILYMVGISFFQLVTVHYTKDL